MICTDMSNSEEYKYCFPYYLFEKGQKIVIYGAGACGRAFYRELKTNGFIDVVAIIDGQIKSNDCDNMIIGTVEALDEIKFDKIIIAVINKQVAAEIKKMLIDRGIQDENIVWDGPYYNMQIELYHNASRRARILKRVLGVKKKKIFLMSLFEGVNLGDFAISEGEYKWIEKKFDDYELIKISNSDWLSVKDIMGEILSKDDYIFFSGGGNYGNMWRENDYIFEISYTFPDNVKVILPNTLSYKIDEEIEKNIYYDMDKFFRCPNLYIVFRDEKSYNIYKKRDEYNRVFYYPDMGLLLDYSSSQEINTGKVLLCLREDSEKKYDIREDVEKLLDQLALPYEYTNTCVEEYLYIEDGEKHLADYLNFYKQNNLVITDRLHGMIFAAITGIPCIAVDNINGKVGNVYKWIEQIDNIKYIYDGKILADDIITYYNKEKVAYDNSYIWNKMIELADRIRELENI